MCWSMKRIVSMSITGKWKSGTLLIFLETNIDMQEVCGKIDSVQVR